MFHSEVSGKVFFATTSCLRSFGCASGHLAEPLVGLACVAAGFMASEVLLVRERLFTAIDQAFVRANVAPSMSTIAIVPLVSEDSLESGLKASTTNRAYFSL